MSQILYNLEDIFDIKYDIINRIQMRINSNNPKASFGYSLQEIYDRSKIETLNKLFVNLLDKINIFLVENDSEIAELPRNKLFTIDRIEKYMYSPTLELIVIKYRQMFNFLIYDTYIEIKKFEKNNEKYFFINNFVNK